MSGEETLPSMFQKDAACFDVLKAPPACTPCRIPKKCIEKGEIGNYKVNTKKNNNNNQG